MQQAIGENISIVRVLRDYKQVEVGLLARLLGRQQSDIEDELRVLQGVGVVERDGDNVALAK